MPIISISGRNDTVFVPVGTNLLAALQQAGLAPDAPCGGNGSCGKCRVIIDGREALACQTAVQQDMTVTLPPRETLQILGHGIAPETQADPRAAGYGLAFDIGTTTLVCYLLRRKTGETLAQSSLENPQISFGADVISRIRAALSGQMEALTLAIRRAMAELIQTVCRQAGIAPANIAVISVVGNPAMQQLFLGIIPENLAKIPFAPALTQAKCLPAGQLLPICPQADIQIVPDLSGFVGADAMGCLLATGIHKSEEITLLVDIGTNGELVLGNRHRMIACATAAGPALEGASLEMGMRAAAGAIDHVWLDKGQLRCSTIGNSPARGICGSGILDAVATFLRLGLLDKRGRIRSGEGKLFLTEQVYLTQEDIRQVQLAKGAICAGIRLMAQQLGIEMDAIEKVLLAGAFGSFLNPESACRIGLLPEELLGKIQAVGNAAGSGAKMLACDPALLPLTRQVWEQTACLDLSGLPAFPKTFAKAMLLREEML